MIPFIDRLPEDVQDALLNSGRLKEYKKNEIVFEEHAFPAFFPIILNGQVKIVKYLDDGKETIINIFGPNDVMLIPPLIDNHPFPATCITLASSKILRITREQFLTFLHDEPEFSIAIIAELCKLLREKNTVIRELATKSPEHRIIVTLIRLFKKVSIPSTASTMIPIKRRDVADMAGLTTETTIRVIRQLAKDGFIRIEKGKIYIDNLKGLQERLKLL